MKALMRALPVLIGFLLLGLFIAVIWSLTRTVPSVLLPPFTLGWKISRGLQLYIRYFPALFTSAVLTGYAIAFAPRKGEAESASERWSAAQFEHLRGAFVLCTVMLALYVPLTEGIKPALARFQNVKLTLSEDYLEYLRLAEADISVDKYRSARARVEAAALIWKGEEVLRLREIVRQGLAEGFDSPDKDSSFDADRLEGAVFDPEGLTVSSSLSRSREESDSGDLYTAHYYAMLAWQLAAGTDPLKQDALRFASELWNRIEAGDPQGANAGERAHFDVKRAGYLAIQNGDWLTAYYTLRGLKDSVAARDDALADGDVERLLEIAARGLSATRFFIDETYSLEAFESDRNVFFSLRRADGGHDAVFIRGIAYARENGRDLAYLRGLEYASFDAAGALRYQFVDSYAKMFPRKDSDGAYRPEVLLRSVDRQQRGFEVGPELVGGEFPEEGMSVLVLDMPYGDVALVTAANQGPSAMTITELLGFSESAARYGFRKAAFFAETVMRLADPFIVLIVSILMLILGWRYRIDGNAYFKAWWVLPLPALTLAAAALIEAAQYFLGLFVAVSSGTLGNGALFAVLGVLAAAFALLSVVFFAQRSGD